MTDTNGTLDAMRNPDTSETPEVAGVVDVPLAALKPHPRNPRKIRPERLEQLKRNLLADAAMLRARPLIALPDGTVIAGNQRLRAATELGWETIPVAYADLDEERATIWAIRDNRGFGEDDAEITGALLSELAAAGADLDLTGYSSSDIDALLAATRPEPPVDPDDAPPLPDGAPSSQLGEVYELGAHRLMCGDATDAAAVAELIGGATLSLLVTDAPYGVSVDHRWRETTGKTRVGIARGTIQGDQRKDWADAYSLIDAPVAYVWHSALHAGGSKAELETAGFEVRQQIVWAKKVHALGRAAYHWRHETCWYAVRKGASARWFGGRSQTTVWEHASPIHIYGGGEGDERTPHPTQKPVAIFTQPIANHTERNDAVCDPFSGSGTALIAAETLGRRCFAMEIDPAYCDVIRRRYATFTNQPHLAP